MESIGKLKGRGGRALEDRRKLWTWLSFYFLFSWIMRLSSFTWIHVSAMMYCLQRTLGTTGSWTGTPNHVSEKGLFHCKFIISDISL